MRRQEVFIRLRRKRGLGQVGVKRFGSFKGAEVGGDPWKGRWKRERYVRRF